jgi:hypothetical protein
MEDLDKELDVLLGTLHRELIQSMAVGRGRSYQDDA